MPVRSKTVTSNSLPSDASNRLTKSTDQNSFPHDKEASSVDARITRYLMENVDEFRQLTELRHQVTNQDPKFLAKFRRWR